MNVILWWGLVMTLSSCYPAKSSNNDCSLFESNQSLILTAVSSDKRYSLTGGITGDAAKRIDAIATSEDGGMKEPLEYAIDSLSIGNDSVEFSFAPIGFKFHGRCWGSDSVIGTFRVPQPPFSDIEGIWKVRAQ